MTPSVPRLRWLCRRGMKELDLLLVRYLDTRYAEAPEREQRAFETLLEQDDPVLWSWLTAATPAPEGMLGELITKLRTYR